MRQTSSPADYQDSVFHLAIGTAMALLLPHVLTKCQLDGTYFYKFLTGSFHNEAFVDGSDGSGNRNNF
jgi:hypothetical protein